MGAALTPFQMAERVATVKKIIQMVGDGCTLKKSLDQHEMHGFQFFRIVNSNASLEQEYYDAQTARSELMVEELVEIADTEPDPQRARVMIDVRKWYASKMRPNKYGDKLDINVSQVVDIRAALVEAKGRVESFRPLRDIEHRPDIFS